MTTAILERLRRRSLVSWLLLLPAAILLLPFFVLPLIAVVDRSLTEPTRGFDNYSELASSAGFRNVMSATFEIAIATTLISTALAIPFAYQLTKMRGWKLAVTLAITITPMITALLARMYAWTVILGRRGVVNDWLQRAGITNEPLDLLFNRTSAVLGLVHLYLPLTILVIYASMRAVDTDLLNAAATLGAGFTRRFVRVFIPLILPGIYASSLLTFTVTLGAYVTPVVLGGGQEITMAVYIQDKVRNLDYGIASAMSVVLSASTIISFILLDRALRRGPDLLAGGSK